MKVTRYELAMKEIDKWRAVARNAPETDHGYKIATASYSIRLAIKDYLLILTPEEAAEIIPEEEAE